MGMGHRENGGAGELLLVRGDVLDEIAHHLSCSWSHAAEGKGGLMAVDAGDAGVDVEMP